MVVQEAASSNVTVWLDQSVLMFCQMRMQLYIYVVLLVSHSVTKIGALSLVERILIGYFLIG